MVARVLRLSLDPARIDGARRIAGEFITSIDGAQAGLVQLSVLANRTTGNVYLIELRDPAHGTGSMRAGELALRLARDARSVGGWEPYEVVVFQPEPCGSVAWLTTTHQAPEVIPVDARIDAMQGRVLEALREQPGYCGMVVLMDRERGRALGCSLWERLDDLDIARDRLRGRIRACIDTFQLLMISESAELLARFDGRAS